MKSIQFSDQEEFEVFQMSWNEFSYMDTVQPEGGESLFEQFLSINVSTLFFIEDLEEIFIPEIC